MVKVKFVASMLFITSPELITAAQRKFKKGNIDGSRSSEESVDPECDTT
jgi:hypothetical protein